MIGQENTSVSAETLPPKKQLAFGLLILERMLPGLIAFAKDTGFNESCYLEGKDAAWAALQDGVVDIALSQACIQSAPDTEQFSHELTSYALNAALAMSDILEFAQDASADHIAQVQTLARDSIDLYLSVLEPSVVSDHPIMRQEVNREEEDIEFLSGLPDRFDNDAVSVLRARAREQPPLLPLASR